MIIYRDMDCGPPRLPPWLEGASNVVRRGDSSGDLVAIGSPLFLTPPTDQGAWKTLPGGWQTALAGDFLPDLLLREVSPVAGLLPIVANSGGQSWHAPCILDRDGRVSFPQPLSRIDGLWQRAPTPDQQRLIKLANECRAQIVSGLFLKIDPGIAAEWAAEALSSIYHLSVEVIGVLALLDDQLIVNVCMAVAGYHPALSGKD